MFQALSLVVHLPPFHAKQFREHALNQVMAQGQLAGDLAPGGGELHAAVGLDAHQGVLFQAAQRHGHRRGRDLQPVCEARGDYFFTFALGFEDGLQVVLFGDGDHLGELYEFLS